MKKRILAMLLCLSMAMQMAGLIGAETDEIIIEDNIFEETADFLEIAEPFADEMETFAELPEEILLDDIILPDVKEEDVTEEPEVPAEEDFEEVFEEEIYEEEILQDTFEIIQEAEVAYAANDYPLYPTKWDSGKDVYWDVAVKKSSTGFPTHERYSGGATNRVSSVTFNQKSVALGNSSGKSPSEWKISQNPSELSSYYPGTSMGSEANTKELTITPAPGYYVTGVTVACTASQPEQWGGYVIMSDAYQCGTWKSGNEYTQTFTYESTGAVTIDIPSLAFCHMSNGLDILIDNGGLIPVTGGTNAYFILIEVAPMPSPLYIEYLPGSIGNNIFSDIQWVEADDANAPDELIETSADKTRFKYTNNGTTDDEKAAIAASWEHYANSITPDAITAAAAAGYEFDGWKAQYYTTCTNYSFSNPLGSETVYDKENEVILHTHVQLTAQWKKLTTTSLTVSKTVVDYTNPDTEFEFEMTLGNLTSVSYTQGNETGTLSKENDKFTFKLSDGEEITFNGIALGTSYIVSEVANSNYTKTVNGAESGILNIPVIVAYTNTRNTANVIVEKLVEGETDATNFGFEATLWEDQTQITFPENVGADISLSADKQTATFTLNKNGTVTFTNLPVGVQLVVVETKAQGADSTTNNFDADADVHYTVLAGNNDKIVFTNIYEEKYGELIITKQLDSDDYHDPHQSFIFTVTNDENGFEMTVVINADDVINGTSGKQVTIKNLPLGKYTVKEDTGWSSRYDEVTIAEMDGGEGSDTDGVVEVKADTTPEVTFTNTRTKKTWIDGFTQCTNLFTGDDNRTKYED